MDYTPLTPGEYESACMVVELMQEKLQQQEKLIQELHARMANCKCDRVWERD